MGKLSYREYVRRLLERLPRDAAMAAAVGREFDAVGILERELLIHVGLKPDDYLIDVGCGSGRLAKHLRDYLRGRYLGIDIVPELIEYARELTNRPDWWFEVVEGLRIPEKDMDADMVCFFSVLTHLDHGLSFGYLRDAKRVLKPGGRILFTFLEYTVPEHRDIFMASVKDVTENQYPINVFISRDAISLWAEMLEMDIVLIEKAGTPFVPLSESISFSDGRRIEGIARFGQSVCVMEKSKDTENSEPSSYTRSITTIS